MAESSRKTARFYGNKSRQQARLGLLVPPMPLLEVRAMRLIKRCIPNQLMRDFPCAGRFDSMGFGLVSFERVTVDSSIQVGVSGPTVWVKVEGKGSFLNSGNLKEFARECWTAVIANLWWIWRIAP